MSEPQYQSYSIQVDGKPVQFSAEEIQIISNGEGKEIWDVFYSACKREFNYVVDGEPDYLKKNGIEYIPNVLKKKDISALKIAWATGFKPFYIERNNEKLNILKNKTENAYSVRNFSVPSEKINLTRRVISQVLTLSLTKKIEAFYESHFSINHVLFSEAFPDPEPLTSFRWHSDGGPASQLHIMVYLDGYEETGGRTEFLSYQDTQSIRMAGYDSEHHANRTTDIKKILPNVDIISPEPRAGDILIFNATQVLHQGIHPTRKTRKVMTLVIQPDLKPWPKSLSLSEIFSVPLGRFLLSTNPFFPYFVPVTI